VTDQRFRIILIILLSKCTFISHTNNTGIMDTAR